MPFCCNNILTTYVKRKEKTTMDVKELLKQYEELEAPVLDSMEDETGMKEIVEEFDEDDELGLFIQTTRSLYDKYIAPAIQGKGKVAWDRLVREGARLYKREIPTAKFGEKEFASAKEYLQNYFKDDLKEDFKPAEMEKAEYKKTKIEKPEVEEIEEGLEEKPAKMKKAEYKKTDIKKPEVEPLKEEVAEKLTFKLGDADVEVTNNTKETFTAEEILKAIEDEKPAIFWNDVDCYHYIMDFSFEKNGKKYWIESKKIQGDFSKFELNIYEGFNESLAGSMLKNLDRVSDKEVKNMAEGLLDKDEVMEELIKYSDLVDDYVHSDSAEELPDEIYLYCDGDFKADVQKVDAGILIYLVDKKERFVVKSLEECKEKLEQIFNAVSEGLEEKPAELEQAEYDETKIVKPEVDKNGKKAEKELKEAVEDENTEKVTIIDKDGNVIKEEKFFQPTNAPKNLRIAYTKANNFAKQAQKDFPNCKIVCSHFDVERGDYRVYSEQEPIETSIEESRAEKIRKGIHKRVVREGYSDYDYALDLVKLIFGKVGKEAGNFNIYNDIATANVHEILPSGGINPIVREKNLKQLIRSLEAIRDFMRYKGLSLNEALEKINAKKSIKENAETKVSFEGKEYIVPDEAFDTVRKELLKVMKKEGSILVSDLQKVIEEKGIKLSDEELAAVSDTCLRYTIIKDTEEGKKIFLGESKEVTDEVKSDFKIGDKVKLTKKAEKEGSKLFGKGFELAGLKGEILDIKAGGEGLPNVITVKDEKGEEHECAETFLELRESKTECLGELKGHKRVKKAKLGESEDYPISDVIETSDSITVIVKPEFLDLSLIKLFPILELGGNELSNKFIKAIKHIVNGKLIIKYEGGLTRSFTFEPNGSEKNAYNIMPGAGTIFSTVFRVYESLNEVSLDNAEDTNIKRQIQALGAEVKAEETGSEKDKKEAERLADKATKSNKLFKSWKKAKGLEKKDESTDEKVLKSDKTGFINSVVIDKQKDKTIAYLINKEVDACVAKIIFKNGKSKFDYSALTGGREELKVKYNKLDKDTIQKEVEQLIKSFDEALNESVVAKFDNGLHEIVRTADGKYFNRYNIKEGKARFTTRPVNSLPTALGALKKRFPEAEEVKE